MRLIELPKELRRVQSIKFYMWYGSDGWQYYSLGGLNLVEVVRFTMGHLRAERCNAYSHFHLFLN